VSAPSLGQDLLFIVLCSNNQSYILIHSICTQYAYCYKQVLRWEPLCPYVRRSTDPIRGWMLRLLPARLVPEFPQYIGR
jgi:hypothetical protein